MARKVVRGRLGLSFAEGSVLFSSTSRKPSPFKSAENEFADCEPVLSVLWLELGRTLPKLAQRFLKSH